MKNPETAPDQAWAALADVAEEQRERQMLARYKELATLSEEDRQKRLRAMAEAEYALVEEKLRLFTKSRLRVWLTMDVQPAQTVAKSYDALMDQMPGAAAMHHVAIVQTVAREFTLAELERLRGLERRILADQPRVAAALPEKVRTSSASKKSWWAFWKK